MRLEKREYHGEEGDGGGRGLGLRADGLGAVREGGVPVSGLVIRLLPVLESCICSERDINDTSL